MAALVKYDNFIQGLCDKLFDIFGTTDQCNVVIHTDAPVAATDSQLADLTQVTGTGYSAGGADTQNDSTRTTTTVTLTGVDVVFTAGAADWIAARYVSMDDTNAATNRLMWSWDYGANFTLGNAETFTVDFGANIATLT